MPVLKNPRWKRLAQELAANETATEATRAAGFLDPRNSTRLTKLELELRSYKAAVPSVPKLASLRFWMNSNTRDNVPLV
jgi:hypothetical protein